MDFAVENIADAVRFVRQSPAHGRRRWARRGAALLPAAPSVRIDRYCSGHEQLRARRVPFERRYAVLEVAQFVSITVGPPLQIDLRRTACTIGKKCELRSVRRPSGLRIMVGAGGQ